METGQVEVVEDKRIALLIAVLALCLAIAETGAKSAQTESLARNVQSTNLWSFFQAKTVRQTTVKTASEMAELQKAGADPAQRAAIDAQQAAWRENIMRWDSEPSTGEGRKELMEKARIADEEREHAMAKYHLYEYAAAALQVAIVVSSASIITGVSFLSLLGIGLGLIGAALGCFGWLAPEMLHF